MAIDVAGRTDNTQNGTYTLWVCPNFEGGECRCERDAEGNPTPGHSAYHYPVDVPELIGEDLTRDQWQERTRQHAIAAETTARGGDGGPAANLGAEIHAARAARAAADDVQTSAQTDQEGAELAARP